MSDSAPSIPNATPLDGLLTIALTGASASLVTHGYLTQSQDSAIVGGLTAAIAAACSWLTLHPGSRSPVLVLRGWIAAAGGGAAWNQAIDAEAAALTPWAQALAESQARQAAGPVAGPLVKGLAGDLAVDAVKAAARAFQYPLPTPSKE